MGMNFMERFQLFITRDQRSLLERLARDRRTDMAGLVREAIDRVYRSGRRTQEFEQAVESTFGILKARTDISSGVEYQNKIRRRWDRPISR